MEAFAPDSAAVPKQSCSFPKVPAAEYLKYTVERSESW